MLPDMYDNMANSLAGIHTPFQARYAKDPVAFAAEVLGVKLWDRQNEILMSILENKYTASSAAIATGKTFTAACAALWYLNTHPYSKVIVTAAPPERQIRDLLFAEIRGLQKRCLMRGVPLVGGDPHTMRIDVADNWWMQGFTIPTTGTPEERMAKFHGHHAVGGVFVLGDEAHGIPPEIFEAFDNVTSAADCRVLLTSNPLAPTGPFWAATRDDTYNTVIISAFEHPNVLTDETVIPGAVDRETTMIRVNKWTRAMLPVDMNSDVPTCVIPWTGEERVVMNPVFFYKVLGQFPAQAQGALVPMNLYQRARLNFDILLEAARKEGLDYIPDLSPPVVGLDVAEFGIDANVFLARADNVVLTPVIRWYGAEIPESARIAARYVRQIGAYRVNVDSIGVGASMPPLLRAELEDNVIVVGVKTSWRPTRKAEELQFFQLRDELGWAIREFFIRKDAAIPPDEELEADLFAFMYEDMPRKGTRITSKKIVRRRLMGRSPGAFDAFAMTFYEGRDKNRSEGGVNSMVLSRQRGRRGPARVRRATLRTTRGLPR